MQIASLRDLRMNCKKLYLRISSSRIAYLRFILEGYDGLAMLSTIDAGHGIVLIRYPHFSEKDIFDLLSDLAPQLT